MSRYYLESGDFHPDAHVTQLIMMATPNRGAPDALVTRMGGDSVPTVSSKEVRNLADAPGYPATYQLFPPRGETFAYDSSASSDEEIDVYDPANGLMPTSSNLNSAVQFQNRLDPSKRGQVEYFCFYGQRHATYTSAYLRPTSEIPIAKNGTPTENVTIGLQYNPTLKTWTGVLP